ncbi:CD4-2 molecule, tandem duplicate 1 [Trachinotus anak]|uniref:CD4-2 molecule, tandem duplicate 1 n=1 Tax=Trachinotus anak TaxID=443729 RepID=UPI0039F179C1
MKTIVWLRFLLGALSASGSVIHTKPGHSVTLECGVSTYKHSLKWYHQSQRILYVSAKTGFTNRGPAAIYTRSRVKYETKLEISGVTKEDAGEFTCDADGNMQTHTLLVVSVSVSPSKELLAGSNATLGCEVNAPEAVSTVQWKSPGGSVHEQSGKVDLNPVACSDNGTWKCMFSYKGKTYSENLNIEVKEPAPETPTSSPTQSSKANNKKACPSCKTPHLQSVIGQLRWWVWVAIGVGCLVVVLLIVTVIVLCKRTRRRKEELQRMKNGRRPKQYCQCNQPTAAGKPQQGRKKGKPSALPLQPLLKE